MNKAFISNCINDTINYSLKIAKSLKSKDILCLHGDLGVGKTVIAKSICKYFGVDDDVISPTFNILKCYNTNSKFIKQIFHFDLYRIKYSDELFTIGFDEYIDTENTITLIEWPDVALPLIERRVKNIFINYCNDNKYKREIRYEC